MNIDDNWMQHNFGCTIQNFLVMNYDEWFQKRYDCTINQFHERTRLICKPDKGETAQQCADRIIQEIRKQYTRCYDLIHLQTMYLSFDEWMEAYHMSVQEVIRINELTGLAGKTKEVINWYRERYEEESGAKKPLYKQEELTLWQ